MPAELVIPLPESGARPPHRMRGLPRSRARSRARWVVRLEAAWPLLGSLPRCKLDSVTLWFQCKAQYLLLSKDVDPLACSQAGTPSTCKACS